MADSNEILAAASKLGGLISTHASIIAYKEIARQLDLDVTARTMLGQYEQLIETLSQKEAQGLPIEVAEKRAFEQLQQSIAMQPTLKRFAQAQMEYMDLMRKVQETINAGLSGQKAAAPAIDDGSTPPPPASNGGSSKIILET